MPAFSVGVDIDVLPSPMILVHDFNELAIGIRSFREPLKRAIQDVVAPSIQHNFDVGGRPAWVPLSESRLAQKKALGYSEIPLTATGKLKQVAGQLNIWTIEGGYLGDGDASAHIDNLGSAEYGEFHLSGTTHMPQRQFLDIQESDIDEIEFVFATYIAERLARAGF